MEIEVGKKYIVKDFSNKIKGNGLTNQLEEVLIEEISPNKNFAKNSVHGWFAIDRLDICDILN